MSQEGMELIVAEHIEPVEIFSGKNEMDKILNGIRERVNAVVTDIETEDGRQEIKSTAYKIKRSKTYLDDLGKDLVSDWKKKAKAVDKIRKHARDTLDALWAEFRQPLTDWEAEQERIEAEEKRKEKERIDMRVIQLAKVDCYMRFNEVAAMTDDEFNIALTNATTEYEVQEAERKAEERKRKEEEERLAAERERLKKIREEQEREAANIKEEQARIATERRKLEEQKRIEEEKKAAAKKEEQDRIEREKREAEDAKRKEALKPDKEKLLAYHDNFEPPEYPEVKSKEALAVLGIFDKCIATALEELLGEIHLQL